MRHPLLRIVLALLVGLMSPMCCCYAAAVAEAACSSLAGVKHAERRSCCNSCSEDDAAPDSAPAETGKHDNGRPDCASCGGAAVAVNSVPVVTFKASAVTDLTPILAAIAPLSDLGDPMSRGILGPFHAPRRAAAHAGRDAQRWHCARIL